MSHIRIDVEDLYFAYDKQHPVLKEIELHISEGESVGVVGANGVGKSTLLKLLVGLQLSYEGSLRVENIPVEKKTLPLVRQRMGYVFQDSDSQLFMANVYEDVAFAPRNYGLPPDEVERRVERALEQTGIGHLRDKPIYQLSGGEKKLAAIATVLSMSPDIVLMDEPSAALDPRNRRNLIGILNSFDHVKLIASHDLDFILDTCERTVLMAEGRIVADDRTEILLRDRELLERYGLELPLSLGRQSCYT